MRFALGAALGALAVALLRGEPALPWRAEWQRALAVRRGEPEAAVLLGRAAVRYRELHARRPRFAHPMLAWHVAHQILPVVALYEVARDRDGEERALADVDVCLAAVSRSSLYGPVLDVVERLPRPFAIFRALTRLGGPLLTPSAGWEIRYLADDEARLAFDVRRCVYVELLSALGVPELGMRFCALDDLRYGTLRTIAFERTRLLARGDDRCDFVFTPRVASR